MSRPIIGVVEYPYEDKDGDMIYEVLTPVIESISKAGGRPVGIFPTQVSNFQKERLRYIPDLTISEKEDIIDSIEMCDAIIKPGALKLFDFDRFIYGYTLEKNIPYLGICAGMQIMAAHKKDWIQNEKIEDLVINHQLSDEKYVHEVILLPGKLRDIVGKNKIMVSSRHSYKIPDNGIHSISALSNDGVIEAIENPYCDFNIGLQWHPELMGDDENSKKIFSKFIDAAEYNAYKKSKERKGR